MNAPIGVMGLGTTALYFLKDRVDHTILIASVVIVLLIGSFWIYSLSSQQRAWLKSRHH